MKRIYAILCATAMAVSLAGCASTAASSVASSSEAAPASTETSTSTAASSSEAASSASTGFDTTAPITVVTREDGSGTRGAFIELTGVEEKDASGNKVDNTTVDATTVNSTNNVMMTVAADETAIGYISLGSLNDTVTAVTVDGNAATAAGVKDGSYTLARPFNIVTKDGLSEVAQDFIDYIMSAEGQTVINNEGYIGNDAATAYAGTAPAGKVVVSGSSSVSPVMEKLIEAYKAVNTSAEIELQTSDSTTGVNNAVEGTCDIGMASRELKDSEKEQGVTSTAIAMDGIAVVVNNANPTANLTTEQIKSIYTGETTSWADVQ
ncbi:MAG: substrate-binding domain-containing protein [Gemmiger sp.]|nr:substrate-binding domain-containing protein [Gemmiger sp.]